MQTRSWLSTEAIRLQFGKQCLVDGLELDLKPGLNMLLGRNGTGKTTLIRCLSGWITPQSGAVYIEQEAIQEIDSKELARKLAVVRTRKDRPAYFPVLDFLKLGRFPYSGFWNQTSENDQRIIDRAIDQIGIQGLLSKNLDQLSDGEYQKVAIAQSLIQETPILLLDEPTSHLDIVHRIEVFQLLKKLGEAGRCLLVATHELDLALELADHLILLDGQGASYQGSPAEILETGQLERLFASEVLAFDPKSRTFRSK